MTITDAAARRGSNLIRANGIDIAVTDIGDGPPLVLLHGALASVGPAWAGSPVAHVDHLARLGERFRIIAPDTRGSGATIHPGGSADFDVLAADVIALIDALELEQPIVAGFSEGGATATLVALRHPDRVRALVNHAGYDYFGPGFATQIEEGLRPLFGGRPGATSADPDAAEQAFTSMGPPMSDTFRTMKADYDDAQGDGHWREYLGQFFDRTTRMVGASVADFATIAVPTLIVAGDRDSFCSVEEATMAYRALPAGQLAIVPDTGHEITTAVVDAIVSFGAALE